MRTIHYPAADVNGSHCEEIAVTIRDFLDRILAPRSTSAQHS